MSRIAVIMFLLGLPALIEPLAGQQVPQSVPLRRQLASEWCWAASAQMAMEALGANRDDVRQRIQAGRSYLPVERCDSFACNSGGITFPTCAFGGFPQFYKFGFEADVTPLYRPLKWLELWQELRCRPVVFAREDLENGQRTGTGHMVVATSAGIADDGPWIAVKDPGPPCEGSMRSETYEEYLGGSSKAHWIDYYHLHKADIPLAECDPPEATPSVFEMRESTSPVEPVAGFIAAIQNNSWIRASAGLAGDGALNCDLDSAISEKTISIASLRSAAPGVPLDSLLVDIGRQRFLCRSGVTQSFSVEVEQRPSGMWRVVTIGDIQLANRLKAIQDDKQAGQQIQEVSVLGLNVRFARLVGDPPGLATPLSSVPGYGIMPDSQEEASLLGKLRTAAAIFRATGPT